MSDRRIRELERRIAAGDLNAALDLDGILRRLDLARDYYLDIIIKWFWQNHTADCFFRVAEPNASLELRIPDPFGLHPRGLIITSLIEPSYGIGHGLPMMFFKADIAKEVRLADPDRSTLFRALITAFFPVVSSVMFERLYQQWVQQQRLDPESIDSRVAWGFRRFWNLVEQTTARVLAEAPFDF